MDDKTLGRIDHFIGAIRAGLLNIKCNEHSSSWEFLIEAKNKTDHVVSTLLHCEEHTNEKYHKPICDEHGAFHHRV